MLCPTPSRLPSRKIRDKHCGCLARYAVSEYRQGWALCAYPFHPIEIPAGHPGVKSLQGVRSECGPLKDHQRAARLLRRCRAARSETKPPTAKVVADCKFLKEEDERLGCFNRFLVKPARPTAVPKGAPKVQPSK
jgi:hypothetical protein